MRWTRRIYFIAIRLHVATGSILSLIVNIHFSVGCDGSIMTEDMQLHSQHNFKPKNHHKNKWHFKMLNNYLYLRT
jgi:hypothetical protein